MSGTVRGNRYLLTAEDSFSRYCHAYPIPNKEALIVAKVLVDQHFNIYGLPNVLDFLKRLQVPASEGPKTDVGSLF